MQKGVPATIPYDRPLDNLTHQERLFVYYYFTEKDAPTAYVKAGYSELNAATKSRKLLTKTVIRTALQVAREKLVKEAELDAPKVLREYALIAFANMRDYAYPDEAGKPRLDLRNCKNEQWAAIESFEIVDENSRTGAPGKVKFKLHSKLAALERLGNALGMFKAENVDQPTQFEFTLNLGQLKGDGDGANALHFAATVTPVEIDNE